MDKECRVSVEEAQHDRAGEARQKRIDALYEQKCAEYRAGLTQGEIAEACAALADIVVGEQLVKCFHDGDVCRLGAYVRGAVNAWIAKQAHKEVERAKERGDV